MTPNQVSDDGEWLLTEILFCPLCGAEMYEREITPEYLIGKQEIYQMGCGVCGYVDDGAPTTVYTIAEDGERREE